MSIEVGEILEGTVTSIMPFGAFVSLPQKKSGLVHISEVAVNYVNDINEHLKTGDVVKVKVLKIEDSGKISLSIKRAVEAPPQQQKPRRKQERPVSTGPVRPADIDWSAQSRKELSFEDKLSMFKQEADERMQALRRSNESKRSGGYSRRGGSF